MSRKKKLLSKQQLGVRRSLRPGGLGSLFAQGGLGLSPAVPRDVWVLQSLQSRCLGWVWGLPLSLCPEFKLSSGLTSTETCGSEFGLSGLKPRSPESPLEKQRMQDAGALGLLGLWHCCS